VNEEIKDMIGRALGDEPRLGVDRHAVLRAGRRRLRLRRAGLAGGTALAVLAVVSASAVAARLGQDQDPTGAAQPTTPAATAPPSTAAPATAAPEGCVVPAMSGGYRGLPDGEATPEELAESARLTAAFQGITFPPGVTVSSGPVRLCAIEQSWGADFRLVSGGNERSVFLEVTPRGSTAPGECRTFGGDVQCRIETLPGGAVVRLSVTPPVGTGEPELVDVTAWRPDGTVVSALETGTMAEQGTPAVPRVLSDEALIALVTAPQLRTEWGGQVRETPPEPSDRRAAELTTVLGAGNPLPAGMQALPVPDARAGALDFYVSQGGYKLNADLVDAAGEGNLFANLGEGVKGAAVACDTVPNCTVTTLPDGSAATVQTDTADGVTRLTLNTVRPSGIQVVLTSSNVSERSTVRGKNVPAPDPTRAEPSLDIAALSRIAMLF
jgi:hypothetical protein